MRKRSITIQGHQTSISLEDEFWRELAALAEQRGVSVNALVTEIDGGRNSPQSGGANLSSTLRVYVLNETKKKISRA